MSEETGQSDPTAEQDDHTSGPGPRSIGGVISNIMAGFRLALFMRVRKEEFRADVNQAAYALLALAAAGTLFSYLIALPNPIFDVYGVGPTAALYIALILGIWVVASVRGAAERLATFTVMLASAFITWSALAHAGTWAVRHALTGLSAMLASVAVFLAGMIWMGLITNRTQRLVLGIRSWKNVGASLLFLLILFAPQFSLPRERLWYEGRAHDETAAAEIEHPRLDIERTFYAQPALLDDAIENLAAERPGITDLYFVGFAGYGEQDVFMREVRSAADLFDRRFDTEGRSLQLINNRSTVDEVPLASVSNLRLALQAIAGRMDTDEDVLFLFLTSHGSTDELSTSFWPLQLNQVSAAGLRSALDDSGIRWRVIVVSACYSGSFVDELQTEETLVITASRKDRNSFGCSNEAEFTYFGRAYLDQALRETHSFIEAFGRASLAVAAREEKEGRTPSQPQIHIGSLIRGKLIELEGRLRDLSDVASSE